MCIRDSLSTARFEPESLVARARQTAFLVPGLAIEIQDERTESRGESGEVPIHRFQYEGGISEFVDYLAVDAALTSTWRVTDEGTFTETVPVMDEVSGGLVSREVERRCEVDIAMRWGSGYDTEIQSFVNIIATPKGGTHLSGFEQGLTKFFRKQIEQNARKLKAGSDKPEKDDILTGLTAVVTVRVPEPQFEGCLLYTSRCV